ncbi:MAG: response regulator [Clostridia bacterium]|nr:response regulator [Clostridia bacterium]
MYSVLLIDDESWVLEDIKSLLDWEKLGFKIVGEANDAESAKQLIESERPDVVISDIRMPGLSGIQLLESYASSDISFKSVFVTAYGKFEYAKKALDLGADGYLLKPVESEELVSTLNKIKKQLDEQAGVSDQMRKWDKAQKLYLLLDGADDEQTQKELINDIGVPHVSDAFVLAIAKEPSETMQNLLSDFPMHLTVLPLSGKQCLLYIQSQSGIFNLITYKNMFAYLRDFCEAHSVYLGLSRIMRQKRKFRSAFIQAENALDAAFVTNQKLNAYYFNDVNVQEILNMVSRQKSIANKNELLKILPDEFRKQRVTGDKLSEVLKNIAIHFELDDDLKDADVKNLAIQFGSLDAYFAYLTQCLGETNRKRSGKTSSRAIVKEIADYIQENYDRKIMINDLAQQFFLNPSYLSNLFKVETGKSFTAYLVECRLKKAKELLENTDLSLYEISANVGYEDYFHFSKLFKKHMNISPANYRKNKLENTASHDSETE